MARERGRGRAGRNQQDQIGGRGGGIPYQGSLLTKNATHASNRAYNEERFLLKTRGGSMSFTLNDQIMPILERFNLDGVARVGTVRLDRDLITAVVERWRRETHSFHFPFGEMAPTLEDVHCLWGLPIDGLPVTGDVDDNWDQILLDVFGRLEYRSFRRPPGQFHISNEWLREPWQEDGEEGDDDEPVTVSLQDDAEPEEVERYARAYMLELLSMVMFPDKSGYIQSMFIQFLLDLEKPPKRSWGSGVLAHLFRNLCMASEQGTQKIASALVFLQIWIWPRIPMGRPRPNFPADSFIDKPFGVIWQGPHVYEDEPRHGISLYRSRIDKLRELDVNWWPYDEYMDSLPEIIQDEREQELWLYSGPLICFWIVEWYAPQRVMRQFGYNQVVPPPMLPNQSDALHGVCHDLQTLNTDWERFLHLPFSHILPLLPELNPTIRHFSNLHN